MLSQPPDLIEENKNVLLYLAHLAGGHPDRLLLAVDTDGDSIPAFQIAACVEQATTALDDPAQLPALCTFGVDPNALGDEPRGCLFLARRFG